MNKETMDFRITPQAMNVLSNAAMPTGTPNIRDVLPVDSDGYVTVGLRPYTVAALLKGNESLDMHDPVAFSDFVMTLIGPEPGQLERHLAKKQAS